MEAGLDDVTESVSARRQRESWGPRSARCWRWRSRGPRLSARLRTAPAEKFTVNPGFRDWGPATVAGTTILSGNSSNRGGLFAVDMLTGKVKWSVRPTERLTEVRSSRPRRPSPATSSSRRWATR
jgi:outer membrane protein assembly factor BamB